MPRVPASGDRRSADQDGLRWVPNHLRLDLIHDDAGGDGVDSACAAEKGIYGLKGKA